jgi:hypothetical protein
MACHTLSLLLVVLTTNVLFAQMDIFFLIGQSNMAGRAAIESQDTGVLEQVYVWNDEGAWERAANPLNIYSNIRKDAGMQKLGPGYYFAKTISQAYPEKELGLVVNARGGTPIEEWQKSVANGYYHKSLERLKAALSQGGTLKAILWHQGESNSHNPETYMTQLKQMVSDYRADLGLPELPFFAGQIGQWRSDYDALNAVLLTIPENISHAYIISSAGLVDIDTLHFNSQSQRTLGKRYAAKVMNALYAQGMAPLEDTYVRSGVYADEHYGSLDYLRIANKGGDYNRKALLKFDISGLSGALTEVMLKASDFLVHGATGDFNITVSYLPDNAWSEGTLTWNTLPMDNPVELACAMVSSSNIGFAIDLDVNTLTEQLESTTTFTLLLSTTTPVGTLEFDSKEGMAPELCIQADTPPAGPCLTIQVPKAGYAFDGAGDDLVVEVLVEDVNAVSNIALYLDETLIRQENWAPFEWGLPSQPDDMLRNMLDGIYTLKAVATLTDASTVQTSVKITVHSAGGGISLEAN